MAAESYLVTYPGQNRDITESCDSFPEVIEYIKNNCLLEYHKGLVTVYAGIKIKL